MPEGDTIFRTARTLTRALVGRPITGFRSNYPLITRFHDDTPLTGQQVECVESRGKWAADLFLRRRHSHHTHAHERRVARLSAGRALASARAQHAHRA